MTTFTLLNRAGRRVGGAGEREREREREGEIEGGRERGREREYIISGNTTTSH